MFVDVVDGLENADRGLDHCDVQPAFVRLLSDLIERLAHVQLKEVGLKLVGDVLAALQVRIELDCVFVVVVVVIVVVVVVVIVIVVVVIVVITVVIVVVCALEGGENGVDEEAARGEEGGLHDGGAFRREKTAVDESEEVGEGEMREIIVDRGDGGAPIEG